MKPNIGISEKNLESITSLLSVLLADETVLYVKTRKFHWNVAGLYVLRIVLLKSVLRQIFFAKYQGEKLFCFAAQECHKAFQISKKVRPARRTTIQGAFPKNDNRNKT